MPQVRRAELQYLQQNDSRSNSVLSAEYADMTQSSPKCCLHYTATFQLFVDVTHHDGQWDSDLETEERNAGPADQDF